MKQIDPPYKTKQLGQSVRDFFADINLQSMDKETLNKQLI